MKLDQYKRIYYLLTFILIINLPPLRWVINIFTTENYTYSNYDGSFKCSEEYGKGGSYKTCQLNYQDYLKQHAHLQNKQLFRTFTLKPWRFWDWYKWISDSRERFLLSYLEKR